MLKSSLLLVLASLHPKHNYRHCVVVAIKENYLDGYFKVQRSEIFGMSLTEFGQEEYDRNRREEGIEIGEARTNFPPPKK